MSEKALCGLEEWQWDELAKPLHQDNVRKREEKFSYVEAHHVIREMNRVFGPTGWTRETVNMERVYDGPYTSSKGKEGVEVAYVARVRVTVRTEGFSAGTNIQLGPDGLRISDACVKEGTGFGSAVTYGSTPSDAYEGATKEAESDAMKRACMMFGDIYGLALYDKDQANVTDEVEVAPEYTTDGRPLTYIALKDFMVVHGMANSGERTTALKLAVQELYGDTVAWDGMTPLQIADVSDRILDNAAQAAEQAAKTEEA